MLAGSKEIPAGCPDLLRELIEEAGSKGAACKAMGIYSSDLSPLIQGKNPFTFHRQQQARNALAQLKGNMNMSIKVTLTDKCPPILKALIEQEGGYAQAAKKIGTYKDAIRKTATGTKEMTEALKEKILAALPPQPSSAPFGAPKVAVERKEYPPWDGKTRAAKAHGVGGKSLTLKKIPVPMADLLDKHHGNRAHACRAAGYSSSTPYVTVQEKLSTYTPKMHSRFMAALAGEAPPSEAMATHALDKYITNLAVCMLNLADYEAVEEIAEIFNGELVCRMPLSGSLWMAIFRMSNREKLEKFKRVARRDAKEIVCP